MNASLALTLLQRGIVGRHQKVRGDLIDEPKLLRPLLGNDVALEADVLAQHAQRASGSGRIWNRTRLPGSIGPPSTCQAASAP